MVIWAICETNELQLEKMIVKQKDMQWIEYDIQKYQSMNLEMAKDGFHPSKEIYQIWGKDVADRILERF